MFRRDLATVTRTTQDTIEGEVIYGENIVIASNIPCHLSVNTISPVNQSDSTASVMYDYKLFYDTSLGIVIKPNDIINVTTAQGQQFEIVAGESHIYPLTVQTHCEDVKIV